MPPSEFAVAVSPPVAVTDTWPADAICDRALTVAVMSAPLLIVASAPDPDSDATPMPTNSVSAIAVIAPSATTETPPEARTSPASIPVTAPATFAVARKTPALIVPPEPPCARAFA